MTAICELVRSFRPVEGERLRILSEERDPRAAVDPGRLCVEVAAGASARLVVLHARAGESSIEYRLGEHARLEVAELFLAEAVAETAVYQSAHSACRLTVVQLAGSSASYRMSLDGRDAESELNGVFLAAGEDRCIVRLRTEHNVPDCRSASCVKGVAGGSALGEFSGLVYVAPDAQRTDARQQSRNVLLSDTARIDTKPQLEIYADDVKCTHGATVGQMDADAVFYMRQRGLSEADARRLQIEGFVGDVVNRCGIGPLCEALSAAVSARMERM